MVISMERWVGKVAVVSGAGAGMGAAIATSLVEAGVNVAGLEIVPDRLEAVTQKLQGKKGKFHPIKCDMTKEEDILKAFKWVSDNVGPVSILINTAGIMLPTSLSDGNTEMWRKVLDTNVLGLCIATREAVRIMKANNIAGHIVHFNSVAGHKVSWFPNLNVYPASKHAVTALTETLRQELNHLGLKIKITSISPGSTNTEIAKCGNNPLIEELSQKWAIMQPEDIADAVMYVLGTPPHVQVHELTIKPVGETF